MGIGWSLVGALEGGGAGKGWGREALGEYREGWCNVAVRCDRLPPRSVHRDRPVVF